MTRTSIRSLIAGSVRAAPWRTGSYQSRLIVALPAAVKP
jgi:hypothetical protein